jgi:hypothetical protein
MAITELHAEKNMTPLQESYRALYYALAETQRAGDDMDGNAQADAVRKQLFEAWLQMSREEKEPFLAPMCLNRQVEGPCNRDFARQIRK